MSRYDEIVKIETEISGYRRGALRACIDYTKNMVKWEDSYYWNNNFLRTMSKIKLNQFKNAIPDTDFLAWKNNQEHEKNESLYHKFEWSIKVSFSDGTISEQGGANQFPPEWTYFREQIEYMTNTSFRLR